MSYTLEFVQSKKDSIVSNTIQVDIRKDIFDIIKKRISENELSCKNIKINSSYSNKIIIKDFFSDSMKVDDVYRYTVKVSKGKYPQLKKHSNNKISNSDFNDFLTADDYTMPSIVLILESPHEAEYYNNNNIYTPIAPAQGKNSKTGGRIENNISIVINELISNPIYNLDISCGQYRIIVCNPVQFQASLAYLHDGKIRAGLRDRVWEKIFEQEKVRKDFYNRIDKYAPKLIINSCTGTCSEQVDNFIKDKFSHIEYYKTSHPFAWGDFKIE